jgi:hypothetical protein
VANRLAGSRFRCVLKCGSNAIQKQAVMLVSDIFADISEVCLMLKSKHLVMVPGNSR